MYQNYREWGDSTELRDTDNSKRRRHCAEWNETHYQNYFHLVTVLNPHLRMDGDICILISETEKETSMWERNIHQSVASWICPNRDRTHTLGMYLDQELNLQPFGVWNNAPTSWATWPGHFSIIDCPYMSLLFRFSSELVLYIILDSSLNQWIKTFHTCSSYVCMRAITIYTLLQTI